MPEPDPTNHLRSWRAALDAQIAARRYDAYRLPSALAALLRAHLFDTDWGSCECGWRAGAERYASDQWAEHLAALITSGASDD